MTDKQHKKDTKGGANIQWANVEDPFVKTIYKKIRNNKKRLDRIREAKQKAREGTVELTQEQKELVGNIGKFEQEIKESEAILNAYRESFPDLPCFAEAASKKKKQTPREEEKHAGA